MAQAPAITGKAATQAACSPTIPPIPKPIAQALKNVAIDLMNNPPPPGTDIMLSAGKLALEAGLLFSCSETDHRIEWPRGGGEPLGIYRYEVYLCSASGLIWAQPIKSSITIPIKGAQASGLARNYMLRDLLRSIFLVPIPDEGDPNNAHRQQTTQTTPQSSRDLHARLSTQLEEIRVPAQMTDWLQDNRQTFQRLLGSEQQSLKAAIAARKAEMHAQQRNGDTR
jgi:hypothetical protein